MAKINYRLLFGVIFGIIVPLIYWSGMWFGSSLTAIYLDWIYESHFPEWIMWPLIPWGGVFLGVLLFQNRIVRISLAPVMFFIFLVHSFSTVLSYYQAMDETYGGETTLLEVIRHVQIGLHLDAIPAAMATLLGLYLARQVNDPAMVK